MHLTVLKHLDFRVMARSIDSWFVDAVGASLDMHLAVRAVPQLSVLPLATGWLAGGQRGGQRALVGPAGLAAAGAR